MKTKHFRIIVTCIIIVGMMISLVACGGGSSANEQNGGQKAVTEAAAPEAKTDAEAKTDTAQKSADPNAELQKLGTQVLTKGPYGEEPISGYTLELTSEDINKLKEMKLRAAIAMQYTGNDWSNTQIEGLKYQFEQMGVEVIAVTDANFKPEKQTSDIETILAKKPDILVSIPVDTVANAPAYKKAAEAGVKVVFMNQTAEGLKPGQDYVTIVSPDDTGNGVRATHLIARAMGGKGKLGIIYHAANFPTTRLRYEACKKILKEMYPDITIAAEQGINGPNYAADAEKAAAAFFVKDPEIKAIWGIWDVPTEGIMAAARAAGRDKDVMIATIDLGKNVAIEMASGRMVKGIAAQTVFDAAVAEAKAAGLAMLGKSVPPFLVMNGLTVDKSNVLESWKTVYHKDPPQELIDAAK